MIAGEEYEAPDPRIVWVAAKLMNEFDMRFGDGQAKCRNAAREIVEYLAHSDDEKRDLEDLRKHWNTFCDADPFEGRDTFIERMEARGYAHLRKVRKADLEESFAAERGIEPGGNLWELTKKGHAALTAGNTTTEGGA